MFKRKVSVEDKIYAVNLYLDGKESQHGIAAMFDVSVASVQQWIRNYESMGSNAFTLKGNKKYSKELKLQAVLDYLAGYGSQDDICKKYGIRSKAKLQIWIKKYNGHEELKSSGTGGNIIMTKGRKTTFEERVEIVQYANSYRVFLWYVVSTIIVFSISTIVDQIRSMGVKQIKKIVMRK